MKLLLESWRTFLEEQKGSSYVVTVDFDNTLQMKEDSRPNPIIINKLKKLRPKVNKIYLVTKRQNTEQNQKEIEEFIKNNLSDNEGNSLIDDFYLTNFEPKWYTLEDLRSNLHFDDSSKEWKTIEENLPDIKLIKVDHKTGKILRDLDEVYTNKQRKWACAQQNNPTNLTKNQAKEMCQGPTKKKKKRTKK